MKQQIHKSLQRARWSLVTAIVALAAVAHAAAATLRTDHASYAVGETIKVAFTNAPGNAKDWIGIYRAVDTPEVVGSTKFLYVDGSTGGASGVANGEVSFTGGMATAGTWVAYLLENDGYRILAQDTFVVTDAAAPMVRVARQIYRKGESISVDFARGPGNAADWIGIYAEGVSPAPGQAAFLYVDNTTAGSVGKSDGTVTFTAGLQTPGKWVAHLLENDTYTSLASDAFEIVLVGNSLATVVPNHEKYLPGQTVKIAFDGGHGNPTDWIGVYQLGQRQQVTGSTGWRYVNNTQAATTGLTQGEVSFDNGFSGPQVWRTFFLLNDGYEVVGEATFEVLPEGSPVVQTSRRTYGLNEEISISFLNAPGNTKDWIAVYPKGFIPDGTPGSTLWAYTDGSTSGTAGIFDGTVTFANGLDTQGEWTAFLLEDDGYVVLASESFTVKAVGQVPARIVSISPADGSLGLAAPDLKLILENRDTAVDLGTLSVKLDGVPVARSVSVSAPFITVRTTVPDAFPEGSPHSYEVSFKDTAGTSFSTVSRFTIGPVVSVRLPDPAFFENFDGPTAEGSLPAGWTASNASDAADIPADLHHLGSLAYANFVVVNSARFAGNFLAYSDTGETTSPLVQLLGSPSVSYLKNGAMVRQFANGQILFGLSGYRDGARQILDVTTPTINLAGKDNIHLSFHSLLTQNQDSIAGIEVSNDGGATWHPVVYYLEPPDIIRVDGAIDLEATFNISAPGDQHAPFFEDGSGGTYGSFIKAPLDEAAGAALRGRVNDDAADGTRVELFRVPAADNQASVQFRIFYAGTDSWYFGLDEFGIYSLPPDPQPVLTAALSGSNILLTWPDLPGFVLQANTAAAAAGWAPMENVVGHSHSVPADGAQRFFRLVKNPN